MYYAGEGIEASKIEAYKWFFISGELGNDDGRENRQFAGKTMDRGDVLEARKLGREWLEEFENNRSVD